MLNKKIIITGNTSGIGFYLNSHLKENNYIIGISKSTSSIKNNIQIKSNLEKLKNLEEEILAAKIPKNIDFLILNAGILGRIEKIEKISIKEFVRAININFLSNKVIIDTLLKKKIKIKNIIAISSGAAKSGKDGWVLYCTTKSAFHQLINVYALENKNVKFINLAPGLAKTKMQDQIFKVKNKKIQSVKKFQKLYKNDKIDSPEKIAHNIVSFLKKINQFKTGSFIDLRDIS